MKLRGLSLLLWNPSIHFIIIVAAHRFLLWCSSLSSQLIMYTVHPYCLQSVQYRRCFCTNGKSWSTQRKPTRQEENMRGEQNVSLEGKRGSDGFHWATHMHNGGQPKNMIWCFNDHNAGVQLYYDIMTWILGQLSHFKTPPAKPVLGILCFFFLLDHCFTLFG